MDSTNRQPHNILILDDHSLYSEGLKRIVSELYSEADIRIYMSIQSLKNKTASFDDLSLLISDIELPGENIFDLIHELKTSRPALPILIISMHKKYSIIRKCLEMKIDGFILKDEDHLLEPALQNVLEHKTFYSPEVMNYYEKVLGHHDHNISKREEEIIRLMCQGFSNQSIADKLFISVETLKTHKKNIKRKIGYSELHELIAFAEKSMLF